MSARTWTEADIAILRRDYPTTRPIKDIAAEINKTEGACVTRASLLDLAKRPARPHAPRKEHLTGPANRPSRRSVSEKQIEQIHALMKKGIGRVIIQRETGVNKSAVRRIMEQSGIAPNRFSGAPQLVLTLPPMPSRPLPVSLMPRLRFAPIVVGPARTCQFIEGDHKGPMCCKPSVYDTSWCDAHGKLVHMVWPPRRALAA